MILSLVLSAAAGAPEMGLQAGADHGYEVRLGRQAYRYDRAGRLIAVSTSAATAPSTPLTADGGGNHAELDDTRLVVTGARSCTLGVKGARAPALEVRSRSAPWPVDGAQAPYALAVNADFATLLEKEAVLVVDLASCSPVTALGDDLGSWRAAAIVDGALATVDTDEDGIVLRRWSLPALAPLDGFTTNTTAILPGRAGPTLLTGGADPRAVIGATTVPLPGEVRVIGTNVFQLDPEGAVRWLDSDGSVRGEAPAGSLHDLDVLDQGDGQWWASDGWGVVHLPGGERAPRVIVREQDEPEGQDALAATATGHLPDPILGTTRGDDYALRQRPQGLIVTRGGQQWGVPVPAWTDTARVSPDGRVVVTHDGKQLDAWQVADGRHLWSRGVTKGTIALGRDWLAVSGTQGWTFLDPKDGAPIGVLDARMGLRLADALVPFEAAKVRGATWSAPAPRAAPWRRELATDGWLRGVPVDCRDPATSLAAYSPWPQLYNHHRQLLERSCAHGADVPPPSWPATATATSGASWSWTAPGKVVSIRALEAGRLVVVGDGGVGVLGPDGALLWMVEDARSAVAASDVVLVTTPERVTAREAATGAVLWTRAGTLHADNSPDHVAFRATSGSAFSLLDPRTGVDRSAPRLARGAAWGWACLGGPCVQAVEMVEGGGFDLGGVHIADAERGLTFRRDRALVAQLDGYSSARPAGPSAILARRMADKAWALVGLDGKQIRDVGVADEVAVEGDRVWLRTGSSIVAQGLRAPATAAAPRVERRPVEVWLPVPAPMVVTPGLIDAAPAPASLRLVDGIDGAILLRDGVPAWTAEGRQRVGVVGDVAIVRDPVGAHEGRALADGRVLWTKDLGSQPAEAGRGALMVGRRERWGIYDERTGVLLEYVDTQVTAAARLGDRTVLATGPRAPQTLREVGGATLGTVDDTIQHIVVAGETVILASYEGRLTALRGGRTLWRVGPMRFQRIRSTPTLVLLDGPEATFALDAATGLLREVGVRAR